MKLLKKVVSMVLVFAYAIGLASFSTSSQNLNKSEIENASLISNEMGGGVLLQ